MPKGTDEALLEYVPYPSRPSYKANMRIKIGYLQDVKTEDGRRERLNNLGYFVGKDINDEGEGRGLFVSQFERFKLDHDLSDDDSINQYMEDPTA